MEMNDLISIIIPCFNQGTFLSDAVRSALRQTYKKIEVIVVNDGSTDMKTKKILKTLPKNVKVLNTKNNGLAEARNIGIRNSKGKYIVPLDADDLLDSKFVEETISVFDDKNDDRLAFVYTDIHFFGEMNYIHKQENLHKYIETYNNHATVCSLIKKSAWVKVKGYNKNMIYGCEDWDFWVALIEAGYRGQVLNKPLFYYRLRSGSMSETTSRKMNYLINQIHKNHKSLYMPKRLEKLKFEELNENKTKLLRKIYKKIRDYILLQQNKPNFYFRNRVKNQDIKLSIIVSAYNEEKYIRNCFESIEKQIYKNFEVIFIDDNSKDKTSQLIKNFIKRNISKNIKLITHKENYKFSRGLNELVYSSKGDYIVFMDADDELLPYSLNEVVFDIKRHKADYISSQMIDIDEDGKVMVFRQRFETVKDLWRGMFAGHLKVIKRSLFDEIGFFHEDISGCQDRKSVV